MPRSRSAWRTVASLVPVALIGATFAGRASAAAVLGSGLTHPELTVETALVVWHPETRVEHLIVGARIEHADGATGYVIPTPSRPQVAPVEEELSAAFSTMIREYRSRTPRWELPSLQDGSPRPWVTFGLRGQATWTVHEVRDSEALAHELAGKGYAIDAAAADWLGGCAPSTWLVGVHDWSAGTTRTLPYVRIEFESPRPFFPYREPSRPADDLSGSEAVGATMRLLRVYVLTTERVAMRLGRSVPSMAQAWLSYEPTHQELRAALGPELVARTGIDPAKRYWMTSFEDYHVARPGNDDVWFERAGAIPKDGDPGTVGDRTEAGLALTPIGPEGGGRKAEPVDWENARGEPADKAAAPTPGMGRASRMALSWGAMLVVAAAAWAWSNAKRV